MLYRIAQVSFDIDPKYEYSKSLLAPYALSKSGSESKKAHFKIRLDSKAFEELCAKNPHLGADKVEHIWLADSVNRAALRLGGVFLHASAIAFRGKAYLFSAPSQTGKSTHTALWQKIFSKEITIINDDRPIIRFENDIPMVYGSPFSGGSDKSLNISVPLGAVIFLKRGEINSLRKLESGEITPLFLNNTIKRAGAEYMNALLDIINRLAGSADFYELSCTPDENAVWCVYNELFGEKSEDITGE